MKKYYLNHKTLLILTVFLRLISSGMQVYIAIILKELVDYIVDQNMSGFTSYIIFAIIYFFCFGLVVYLSSFLKASFLKNTIAEYKNDIFNGLIHKKYFDFNKDDQAKYISNLTNDINIVQNNYITQFLDIIGDVTVFILTIFVLLYINPILTISLLVSGLLLIIVPYIFGKPFKNMQNRVSYYFSNYTSKLKDLLGGYETIITHNIQDESILEFEKVNKDLEKGRLKFLHLQAVFAGVSTILSISTLVVGIIIAGYFVIIGGLTAGSLVAVIQLSNTISAPLESIVKRITLIKGAKDVCKKLLNIINEPETHETKKIEKFNSMIEFDNVIFSYDNEEKSIIKNFSFKFYKNKKYIIVGESGAGKSTIMKLLLGFYKNYKGNIYIDGTSIKNLDTSDICRDIAYVSQDIYLFNKSLKDNILLNKEFDQTLFKTTLDKTMLDSFANSLPFGINTELVENAENISGGQKQRVGLARAFFQEKNIFLLDEPTVALDIGNSLQIENNILLDNEKTVINISHNLNLSTLSKYDEIIVMNNGNIIENGNLETLLTRRGYLYDLIEKTNRTSVEIS